MFIIWTLALGVGFYTFRFGQYIKKEGNHVGGIAIWVMAAMSLSAPFLLYLFNVSL